MTVRVRKHMDVDLPQTSFDRVCELDRVDAEFERLVARAAEEVFV